MDLILKDKQDIAEIHRLTVYREAVVRMDVLLKHHRNLKALFLLPRVPPPEMMEGADRRLVVLCVILMGLTEDAVRHMGMFVLRQIWLTARRLLTWANRDYLQILR